MKNFLKLSGKEKKINFNIFARISLGGIFLVFFMFLNIFKNGITIYDYPITFNENICTILLIGASIIIFLLMALFPNKSGLIIKICSALFFIISLLLFLPFMHNYNRALIYLNSFICFLIFGEIFNLIVISSSIKNSFYFLIESALILAIFMAIINNGIIEIGFIIENIVFLIISVLIFVVSVFLPNDLEQNIVSNFDNPEARIKNQVPIKNVYLTIIISALLFFSFYFSNYAIGQIAYGKLVFYLSAIVSIILFLIFIKKLKLKLIKVFSYTTALIGFGFIILLINNSIFNLIGCVLLGCNLGLIFINIFFAVINFIKYPSRWLAPFYFIICCVCYLITELIVKNIEIKLVVIIGLVIGFSLLFINLLCYPRLTYSIIEIYQRKTVLPKAHPFIVLAKEDLNLVYLLLGGYSDNQICKELYLTSKQLHLEINKIYQCLAIKNKNQLFKMGISSKINIKEQN